MRSAATPADRTRDIEFTSVSKVYPGRSPVTALHDVNLAIGPHDLVAIVGASGSGKSTMLNLMGGLDRPTSGTVRLRGDDISALSDGEASALRGRSIGFVFQNFHLLGRLSVLDNVLLGTMYLGGRANQRRTEALELIDRVGLSHRLESRAADLSGGERQRVAIARALAGSPALVLADEPTGNLDSSSGAAIVELLLDVHASGTTVVTITHDLAVADRFDRVIEIKDGRLGPQ